MQRRAFITLVGGAAASWPLGVRAQQAERMRRIGVLMPFAEGNAEGLSQLNAFRDALAGLGWIAGRNMTFDYRWTAGSKDLVRTYAKELLALAPDLILTASVQLVSALRDETRTIPILFGAGSDPVDLGLVDSLARPGGNVTGFTIMQIATTVKFLELIKEIDPRIARVLVLMSSHDPSNLERVRAIEASAPSLKVAVSKADISIRSNIERAINDFASTPAGGLIVLPSPVVNTHGETIIMLAAQHRLPAIYSFRTMAAAGGLMTFGPDRVDQWRRAATYADRILRGEKPGDLPIQTPTKFELVINLKTAKGLGLTVPPSLLGRADEVIE
jgi:putative ABC transport system substrate-binding protein